MKREKLRLRHLALGATFIIAGLVLLILSDTERRLYGIDIETVLSTLGTILIITPIFNWFFDVAGKEALFEEFYAQSRIAKTVADCGIEDFYEDSTKVDYSPFIRSSKSIDLAFSYAGNFLRNNRADLLEAIKSGTKISIMRLSDGYVLSAMRKLGWTEESISAGRRICEDFAREANKLSANSVIDYEIDFLPRYSVVQFDAVVFVIKNTAASGRVRVPCLRLSRKGPLAEFYSNDIQNLREMKCQPTN